MNVCHIQDRQALSDFIQKAVPEGVAKRLFLVEDMTGPVIELLGATLRCQPDLFAAHMQHYGDMRRAPVDSAGTPLEGSCISCSYRGPTRPKSYLRQQAFFSIPFRKKLRHKNEDVFKHAGNRTMFRDYNNFENTVEERISGALYAARGATAAIGEATLPSSSMELTKQGYCCLTLSIRDASQSKTKITGDIAISTIFPTSILQR